MYLYSSAGLTATVIPEKAEYIRRVKVDCHSVTVGQDKFCGRRIETHGLLYGLREGLLHGKA